MKTKKNISVPTNESEIHSPLLELIKKEGNSLKVPDGYFDTLNPRIIDKINLQENRKSWKQGLPVFRKPIVWAPVLATGLVAVLLIFVIPVKNPEIIPAIDEWTEMNMAYDASFAEEALFTESYTIDNELENSGINISEASSAQDNNEITDEEIADYLKEQDLDPEMINEY